MSLFNWINKVLEEIGEKMGRMVNTEAAQDWTMEG
jgi:hypothetical protein